MNALLLAIVGLGYAADALDTLPVKGRAPKTGYERAAFGPAWADVDHNGCATRDDILARDLVATTVDADGCRIRAGWLSCPYTGHRIAYVRGDASEVDIDHVVALSNAWQTGAFAWTDDKRTTFANDPDNLLAVEAAANRQKGDGDAATWLPRRDRCGYVRRQIGVKQRYGLWVTPAEHDAIARVLATCPPSATWAP